MEPLGVFADGEWESLGKMFSSEEFDFLHPQFFGQCTFPVQHDEGLHFISPSALCPTSEADASMVGVNESNLFYSPNTLNSNLSNLSQDSSYGSNCSSSVFIPTPTLETSYFFSDSNHIPMTNDASMSIDENKVDWHAPATFSDIVMENASINEDMNGDKLGNSDNGQHADGVVPATELQLKRKFDVPAFQKGGEEKINVNVSENMKKKPRVSRDVQKTKKNVQSKKSQNLSPKGNDGEESNGGSDGQSSTSYSSEDDNGSQETNGGETSESKASLALNLNGKARASRGTATDPQSLYARKRRERINERLKILQNLVPNGTKVDISTMLEEAVHYVKFLQFQIKLLSSDDMWMYAPLAYNGFDICLNQRISPLL
ncbi:hypothetical protein Pint_08655 [Pistacia integerrima]|uniref:Uncharacterized protein n=1 Tax=Pistacia integerrima TaxID=434235 RepID=A0ACC0XW06_9ROSI|nr:hypothetical protein Pint_08655 [Pistacia integerrima]